MVEPGQVVWSERVAIMEAAQDELESAVREHSSMVYRIAFAALHNHQDAEDAAQETFLKFWRSRKRWAEIRDRRAWLARTAWRTALDRRRKALETGLEDVAEVVRELRAQGASPEEIAARDEMRAVLRKLIITLPPELRDPLTLSTMEELTSLEISEILKIPEGSVRNRLLRARELLRGKLAAVLERKHA